LLRAANHGRHEWVDIQTVDDLVLVHVGFKLKRAVHQDVDKRVDVQAVNFTVEVHVPQQWLGSECPLHHRSTGCSTCRWHGRVVDMHGLDIRQLVRLHAELGSPAAGRAELDTATKWMESRPWGGSVGDGQQIDQLERYTRVRLKALRREAEALLGERNEEDE
jgi:hypothetical protein